jgi:hypothetical protein
VHAIAQRWPSFRRLRACAERAGSLAHATAASSAAWIRRASRPVVRGLSRMVVRLSPRCLVRNLEIRDLSGCVVPNANRADTGSDRGVQRRAGEWLHLSRVAPSRCDPAQPAVAWAADQAARLCAENLNRLLTNVVNRISIVAGTSRAADLTFERRVRSRETSDRKAARTGARSAVPWYCGERLVKNLVRPLRGA